MLDTLSKLNSSTDTNEELKLILEILMLYNLRASEVLFLTKSNIINNTFVLVSGRKKSRNIIIRDREIVKSLMKLARDRTDKLFVLTNYKMLYRYILQNYSHVINTIKSRKNRKVTHAFRYINTQGFKEDEDLSLLLHHKSHKSNINYTNKLRNQ